MSVGIWRRGAVPAIVRKCFFLLSFLLFLLSACGSLMFIFRMMGRTRYADITRETYFNVGKDRPVEAKGRGRVVYVISLEMEFEGTDLRVP